MQRKYKFLAAFLLALVIVIRLPVRADTLVLTDGQRVSGTVLQTNAWQVLVLGERDLQLCARTNIQSVTFAPELRAEKTRRLPDFHKVLLALNQQKWAKNLTQIPATVIDAGPMKNVPYVSFRCGGEYEINIYGDLAQPSAIEAGAYGKLAKDELAKSQCENFLHSILSGALDRATLRSLDWQIDLQVRDGLTFEITPQSAPDAYGGWWISIYSTEQLDAARASEADLKLITASSKTPVSETDSQAWTGAELRLARRPRPTRISFKNAFGTAITNAEVIRVSEGVSLDWRDAIGSGTVRLADLSEELRSQFGYDSARDAAEREERAQFAARQRALQSQLDSRAPQPAAAIPDPGFGMGYGAGSGGFSSGGGSGYSGGGGGTVFVKGYTRSNGTYVNSYTRSAPSRGGRR